MNRAGRRQGAALPACRFRGIGGAAPDGSEAKRTPVPLPLDSRQLGIKKGMKRAASNACNTYKERVKIQVCTGLRMHQKTRL